MSVPVIFLIFNRPSKTAAVFNAIREYAPKELIIVADGPRKERIDDVLSCETARQCVEKIDWDCHVTRDYAQNNLGCRHRVSSGISRAFSIIDRAIILEDDCLPDPSFFYYCEELLNRYEDNPQIASISGNCFIPDELCPPQSYYFSRFTHIWGWATWRRAWQGYDEGISKWPELKAEGFLNKIFPSDSSAVSFWTRTFDLVHSGRLNTWDHQFQLNSWLQNGLSVIPAGNLVANIGFDAEGTHTSSSESSPALKTLPIKFPLIHPAYIQVNAIADSWIQKHNFGGGLLSRVMKRIRKIFFA